MSEISPTDAWAAREDVLFLDVREPAEWDAGHIDGARHVPMQLLGGQLASLPTDQRIVAVCRSGARSGAVADALRQRGYDIANLSGGMQAWAHAQLPYVTDDGSPPRVA